jgi:hypothetical protein
MADQSGNGIPDDGGSIDESTPRDAIDESDTVTPNEGPVVSEGASEPGQWKVSRSPTLDQMTQSIIGIILVTLVGILVLLGAVIFMRDPSTDLRPYTANLLTPLTGLAGIAIGFFFGRKF